MKLSSLKNHLNLNTHLGIDKLILVQMMFIRMQFNALDNH